MEYALQAKIYTPRVVIAFHFDLLASIAQLVRYIGNLMAVDISNEALDVIKRLQVAHQALANHKMHTQEVLSTTDVASDGEIQREKQIESELARKLHREFWSLWNLCEDKARRTVKRFIKGVNGGDFDEFHANCRVKVFRSLSAILTVVDSSGGRVYRDWRSIAELENYIACICLTECINQTRLKKHSSIDDIDIVDTRSFELELILEKDEAEVENSGETYFNELEIEFLMNQLVKLYIVFLTRTKSKKPEKLELISEVIRLSLEGIAGGVIARKLDVSAATVSKTLNPFKDFLKQEEVMSYLKDECPSLPRKLDRLAARGPEHRGRPSKGEN